MDLFDWIIDVYRRVIETGDPRTNQWPLVRSPLPSLYFFGIYVSVSITGAVFIKLKSPLPIQPLMVAFNIAIVMTSCYLCKEFLMGAYLANYSLVCEPLEVTDDPLSVRMATAFWVFYLMRFTTGLDTVFLILQKKNHQIPLRHVFHHASTPIAAWIAVKYAPGGQVFLQALLTAVVHIIIYTYIAALCYPSSKKYVLPFRKWIPAVHVTHLTVITVHAWLGVYKDCFVPNWTLIAGASYCTVLIILHIILGESVLVLDVLAANWPRSLYGASLIAEMKKSQ